MKIILGNFVFINEENKSKEIQGKNVLSFTKFVLGGFCPGGVVLIPFRIIFEQNCDTAAKKARNKDKGGSFVERANILSKSQLVKLAQQLRNSQLFETNIDQNL